MNFLEMENEIKTLNKGLLDNIDYPSRDNMIRDVNEAYSDMSHFVYMDTTDINILKLRWLIMMGAKIKRERNG